MSELTFGQRLVGLTFNPSGDDKVGRAKQLCAELADCDIKKISYKRKKHKNILKSTTT